MPLGGFSGSDPTPTLESFKEKVGAGEICFFIQQEAFLEVQATDSESTAISSWVEENFSSEVLDNTTVYRLTTKLKQPKTEARPTMRRDGLLCKRI
ncbi:hypothetical protein GCM10018951_05190 [Pseudarthrobacter polychromogenes]